MKKLNIILKTKRISVVIGINNVNIEREPNKLPLNILFKEAFLFNVLFTVKRRIKSKNKFNKKTKSKYTIIISPNLLYKKEKKNNVDS